MGDTSRGSPGRPAADLNCQRGVRCTTGPVAVLVVPPIRKNYFGYVPIARPPTTFPRESGPGPALQDGAGQTSRIRQHTLIHLIIAAPAAAAPVPNRARDANLTGYDDPEESK